MIRKIMVRAVSQLLSVGLQCLVTFYSQHQHLPNRPFKIGSIIVSSFCTRLSQSASFCLKASVFFLRTKILVKGPCREVGYYARLNGQIYLSNTLKAYIATSHLTKILLKGSSFLSKSVLFLHKVQVG